MTRGQRNRRVGAYGEHLAARRLVDDGMVLVDRNWRCDAGEIDLVLREGDVLVFCEVKTARVGARAPWESLHDAKQSKVRRMAISWLTEGADRPYGANLRFDGVAVLLDSGGDLLRLDHLEAAF